MLPESSRIVSTQNINLVPRIEFLFQALFREQKYCPHCHCSRAKVVTKKYGTYSGPGKLDQKVAELHIKFESELREMNN